MTTRNVYDAWVLRDKRNGTIVGFEFDAEMVTFSTFVSEDGAKQYVQLHPELCEYVEIIKAEIDYPGKEEGE